MRAFARRGTGVRLGMGKISSECSDADPPGADVILRQEPGEEEEEEEEEDEGDDGDPDDLTPNPPWRIHLTGAEQDLQDLAAEHSLGRTRVVYFQAEYFLEANILNELSDCNRAVDKAQGILHIICGLAKVRRFSASPVKAASVLWTDDNGNWVGRIELPSVQYRVVPGTKYLEGARISEQILALAEINEEVRMNLMDFLGEWDFSRLRRITRGILVDLGGIKSGADEVVRLGWATEPECKRFLESVNFGNEYYLGAHSRLERAPDQNPMSLVMASEFVRKLLARWIASKIVAEK